LICRSAALGITIGLGLCLTVGGTVEVTTLYFALGLARTKVALSGTAGLCAAAAHTFAFYVKLTGAGGLEPNWRAGNVTAARDLELALGVRFDMNIAARFDACRRRSRNEKKCTAEQGAERRQSDGLFHGDILTPSRTRFVKRMQTAAAPERRAQTVYEDPTTLARGSFPCSPL
jgi:hypothetical protein